MKTSKYKIILCDLGNCLINFDHRISVKKILPFTKKDEQSIYDLFFDSGITSLYERGKISTNDFYSKTKDMLDLKMSSVDFMRAWCDIFFEVELNKRLHEVLNLLKKDHRLVMISNINESHFEFLKDKMKILDIFDRLVLSYEVGYRKPSREIYIEALKGFDLSEKDAFYIDDREDLVLEAKGLGIDGVVFNSDEAIDKIKGIFCI